MEVRRAIRSVIDSRLVRAVAGPGRITQIHDFDDPGRGYHLTSP